MASAMPDEGLSEEGDVKCTRRDGCHRSKTDVSSDVLIRPKEFLRR